MTKSMKQKLYIIFSSYTYTCIIIVYCIYLSRIGVYNVLIIIIIKLLLIEHMTYVHVHVHVLYHLEIFTFPSEVTAPNTVEAYGDQAMSPTTLFSS